MPSAAVDQAIKAKLTSDWTLSPVLGVNNLTEPPAGVDAFLVVQYPVVNGSKPVLSGKFFEEGAARLRLNCKSGLDLATVLPWGDTLAGLFREYKPRGGFETFTPSAPMNDSSQSTPLRIVRC